VARGAEHLSSKCEALSSNPSSAGGEREKREREKREQERGREGWSERYVRTIKVLSRHKLCKIQLLCNMDETNNAKMNLR
jgi:hypothetical protein